MEIHMSLVAQLLQKVRDSCQHLADSQTNETPEMKKQF